MTKCHIALAIPSLVSGGPEGRGGPERVFLQYARMLRAMGHRVTFVSCGPRPTSVPSDVAYVDLTGTGRSLTRYPILALRRLLRSKDITHIIGTLNMGVVAPIAARLSGRRVHSVVRLACPPISAARPVRGRPWTTGLKVLLASWISLLVCNSAIAQSGIIEDEVRKLTLGCRTVFRVGNPVDTSLTGQRKARRSAGPVRLLYVGRLAAEKRLGVIIDAISRSSALRESVEFKVLGAGPELTTLQQLAKTRGVGERVVFKGFVDNPGCFMIEADLMVLPSQYEGLPNVVLEAAALGTPLLVARSPGIPWRELDQIQPWPSIDVATPDRWADGILRALSMAYQWDSAQLRSWVGNEYSVAAVSNQLQRAIGD